MHGVTSENQANYDGNRFNDPMAKLIQQDEQ